MNTAKQLFDEVYREMEPSAMRRREMNALIDGHVREKVREFLAEHGIEANITMSVSFSWTRQSGPFKQGRYPWDYGYAPPVRIDCEYIAIWNSKGGLPGTRRWLNKIVVTPKVVWQSIKREDGTFQPVPASRLAVATDPLFTRELEHEFRIFVKNLIDELKWEAKNEPR